MGRKSFEFGLWRACYKNVSLHIMFIYRPSRSLTNPVETAIFLEEYPKFLSEILSQHKNTIMIMGDFNIWIDDMNNKDANTYLRAMESLGLEQHVTFSTHSKDHTFDHVFTESGSKMIVDCRPRIYISDYRSVMAEVSIPKENISKVTRIQRKLQNLNIEELCHNMDFTCVYDFVDSVIIM